MTSAGSFSFAAAVWMVNRIHRDSAIDGTPSQPAIAAGFSDGDVFVIEIADLSDRRHAILRDFASLA